MFFFLCWDIDPTAVARALPRSQRRREKKGTEKYFGIRRVWTSPMTAEVTLILLTPLGLRCRCGELELASIFCSTLSGPQSRFGGTNHLKFENFVPTFGSAVLEELIHPCTAVSDTIQCYKGLLIAACHRWVFEPSQKTVVIALMVVRLLLLAAYIFLFFFFFLQRRN